MVSDEDTAAEIVNNVRIKLHTSFNLQSTFTYVILNTESTFPQVLQKSVWHLRSGQLHSQGSENNTNFVLFYIKGSTQLSFKLPQTQKT